MSLLRQSPRLYRRLEACSAASVPSFRAFLPSPPPLRAVCRLNTAGPSIHSLRTGLPNDRLCLPPVRRIRSPAMAAQLASFTRSQVESHNSRKSCFVTVGANVYDVTDFLDSHPGGDDLILEYAGKDIAAILRDEVSHVHSEAAYEVLTDSLVGTVPSERPCGEKTGGAESSAVDGDELAHPRTGMSSADDLSKETDYDKDYTPAQVPRPQPPAADAGLVRRLQQGLLPRPGPPPAALQGGGLGAPVRQLSRALLSHALVGHPVPVVAADCLRPLCGQRRLLDYLIPGGRFRLRPVSYGPWWNTPSTGSFSISTGKRSQPSGLYIPRMHVLTSCLAATFRTTESASRCTSCSTASTTTSPWTSTGLSCRPPS